MRAPDSRKTLPELPFTQLGRKYSSLVQMCKDISARLEHVREKGSPHTVLNGLLDKENDRNSEGSDKGMCVLAAVLV